MKKLIAGISLLASLPLLADLTLAENGKSAYVIAIPVQPGGYEKRFAEEFRQNFARMTGAELPIRKENEIPAGTPRIAVGKTELAKKNGVFRPDQDPEELIVRTVGRDLILAGGSAAGTGFAVYDFLERQGGCRWYDDQNIVIPRYAAFRIAELNIRRSPAFRFRRIFMLARNWEMKQVSLSLPMKLSYNSTGAPVYGAPSDIHTFYLYCKNWPKDRLYLLAKTPEGRRQALRGQLGPNFCMTHPESLERFKKQLREFIAADRKKCKRLRIPPPWLYNLSRNDGSQYFCRCEKCKAISDKHGESGLMLWFLNQLAEDIAGDYPDILLQTSASSFASAPPKGIKAAPNLVVELAHNTGGNYYSPVENDHSAPFSKHLKEWRDYARTLAVWDYWVFYWDAYPEPYHNVHQIKKDLEFYHKNGVRMLRIESEAADTSSFFQLKYWLGCKLMDDLTQNDRKLIDDFLHGFYGPAAPEMRELLDYIAERQKGQTGAVFTRNRVDPNTRPWIDAEFFRRADDIFRRAEAKCVPGSRELKNVHRERIPVDLALMHKYSKMKPAVSRKELADRYLRNMEEHIRYRKKPSSFPSELMMAKNEAEKFLREEEIDALKEAPPPTAEIGPDWSAIPLKLYNSGLPAKRKLAVFARNRDGLLQLKLTDFADPAGLRNGKRIFQGDDWEIFLAADRKGDYFQLMIGPSGKFEIFYRHRGRMEDCSAKGLKVECSTAGKCWQTEVVIPLNSLPVKKVSAGNIVRGIPGGGIAWSPAFEKSYGVPARFGTLILK